jgi:type I restriction enzyme M protein
MLDTETKRRIDEARDILVGKLPDPKSQVEQITIALIYKFMYDMDKESLDFGGEATFFSGEWEKYSWTNIFDPKIGGHEMLNLYGEAIVKLNQNPNIPQLFRDIFKNAYLPYRDPETLKLFLKTINEFHYDHSERLGDAFEYLLSVLGSQGDAGQFRTPRHIIDFIVAVLQPKKNETICDPACGTAGFLISSYKYILKTNPSPLERGRGEVNKGLTQDDKKKMMQRFVGYDISPDMVRLSLVNMYLHNFTTPKIYEYDTLTSEDRWNESFDIIMANPPFMSPKGGIKPHKKFTMQANRSEVLFVDYIAEHINPTTGRAGVIVPEGIIFQSANAYKQLRQLLVDKKFLYAVVSLPAGIFQPYSGVKTSILLMDKTLAKKTDNILFVKIENDGFDLGAQRRAIDKNDLTAGLLHLQEYKEAVLNNTEFTSNNKNVFVVDKKIIKGAGDYNLSVDRYRINENSQQSNFEIVRLDDVCEIKTGKKDVNYSTEDGLYPFFTCAAGQFKSPDYSFDDEAILLPGNGANVGMVFYYKGKFEAYQRTYVLSKFREQVLPLYIFSVLQAKWKSYIFDKQYGSATNYIVIGALNEFTFPLPPVSIQQQIVAKIENYQVIINGSKQVVENYKPQIDIDPDWEIVELGDVCEIKSGGTPSRGKNEFWNGNIPWIKTGQINFNRIKEAEEFITSEGLINSSTKMISKGTILMAMYGQGITRGKVAILDIDATINQACAAIFITSKTLYRDFLFQILISKYDYLRSISDARGGNQSNLNSQLIKELEIPLPPLPIQQQIVNRIEQEQQLVNANKELIKIFEQKIKDEINKLWQSEKEKKTVVDKEKEMVALAAEGQ